MTRQRRCSASITTGSRISAVTIPTARSAWPACPTGTSTLPCKRFGASGSGWIPYALDRMDFEWEDRFRDLGLTMKPSDYWRRQCKATFQFDRIGTKLIDDMGVETLMWASDYPHTDGVWPESSKYIEEQLGHLPSDVKGKITCENAGQFYGLIR